MYASDEMHCSDDARATRVTRIKLIAMAPLASQLPSFCLTRALIYYLSAKRVMQQH